MGTEPSTTPDPFHLQESRRERALRRSGTRRRVVAGVLAGVVVLGGAGYAAYHFATRDGAGTTPTVSGSTAGPVQSSPAPLATSTPGAPASTSTTSNPPLPNFPSEELTVIGTPESIDLAITLQDGTTLFGKTPFAQEVPGGQISIEFHRDGYNAATRQLTLDRATELKVWLDPAGQLFETLARFKGGLRPSQVAFSPDGKELWVSFTDSSALGVYDPATGVKLGAVPTGDNGTVELIMTKDGQTVYASQQETATVFEIDRSTRTVKRELATGGTWPRAMALSPDEKTLYTANWASNDVAEIDLATGDVVRKIPTAETPSGLYITPDALTLYVAGYKHGDIERIDLATGRGVLIFQTGGAMWHMVADEDLGLLYVDDMATNEVYVVDLLTDEISKLANTDEHPSSIDLSPDGSVLYVCNRGEESPESPDVPGPEWGSVLAIDTATGKILDAIIGGNQCTGLDVSADGLMLAFSDLLDHKIRVYTIPPYDTLVTGNGGRAEQRFEDKTKQ